ncbi:MAG: histidinol-phosphate transaminase, partial [Bacteroidota bacterium]
MFELSKITRQNVKDLRPYSSARSEFSGHAEVSLDANENPFGFGLNRYPDASLKKLKHAFSSFRGVEQDRLIFGNGSDEIIDMLIRAFCEPGLDSILTFPPTFGMYGVSAAVNNVKEIQIPLDSSFQLEVESVRKQLSNPKLKLIFVCSPNNPTGNQMDLQIVRQIADSFHGLVVLDEAYIDFSGDSLIDEEIPNLVILQTFSKTFGLAGARLGVGIAQPAVIDILQRIKPPYNVNSLTQEKAIEMLQRPELVKSQIAVLKHEKEKLEKILPTIQGVKKVYPSDANFLLVEFEDASRVYREMLQAGIVLRDRSGQVDNTLRITIGTPEENHSLIDALKGNDLLKDGRVGSCLRTTAETKIFVEVNLDDPSNSYSATGVGFFDHMLDQIARHGSIGLQVKVDGDLHIDTHHTIEDTALALGTAFDKALKDRKGIERYGFLLPMDDS